MILATDFDGTLCRNGTVTDTDKQAISKFRKAGHFFGVVTGRNFNIYNHLKTMIEFDFVICLNGALAIDTQGEIIFEKRADGKILPEVFETLKEVCIDFFGVAKGKNHINFKFDLPEGDGNEVPPISKFEDFEYFTMLNSLAVSETDAVTAVDTIRRRHGEYLNPLMNGWCIDIPPIGTDKGTGIAQYADIMNVPHDHIWTAGDNYNDMAMITRFRGCAMENAVQELKDNAKGIYPDIASIIEEMLAL